MGFVTVAVTRTIVTMVLYWYVVSVNVLRPLFRVLYGYLSSFYPTSLQMAAVYEVLKDEGKRRM